MYYTQRVELAERFLSRFLESYGSIFREHWSSDWHMGEKIVQYVCSLEGDILGVAEFFIETSAEMDVLVTLSLGISSVPFSELWYQWMPDDLHPRAVALHDILRCESELSLEIHDEPTLHQAFDKVHDYCHEKGRCWIDERSTREQILSKLAAIGDIEALERSILLLAGCRDLEGALRRFDEVLWPQVTGGGERMILERWRRLKAVILEENDKNIYAARDEEELSQTQAE